MSNKVITCYHIIKHKKRSSIDLRNLEAKSIQSIYDLPNFAHNSLKVNTFY